MAHTVTLTRLDTGAEIQVPFIYSQGETGHLMAWQNREAVYAFFGIENVDAGAAVALDPCAREHIATGIDGVFETRNEGTVEPMVKRADGVWFADDSQAVPFRITIVNDYRR